MATTGIWNHAAASISLARAHPMDGNTGTSGGTGSSTDGATISANDFLTLLVTEMQNQDPTADTDPNEYINQLVNVNSLEQLIQINQTLSAATGNSGNAGTATGATAGNLPGATPAGNGATSGISGAAPIEVQAVSPSSGSTASYGATASEKPHPATAASMESPAQVTEGNIGVPRSGAAAHRVAQALGSRLRRH